jgi:hypothetical protein
MLANNCFGLTDEPDEPGNDLRANPFDDSGASSSELKAIAKEKAKDSFGRRMTQARDMSGGRIPKTGKATPCYAANAIVMNTLRQGEGSGSGSSFSAWATSVDPNPASGSQQSETGGAASTPRSNNDIV